ncbi:hypothetical protein M885DRAFT_314190 [Pelagophyceae sp. CCMP2097]|nr:hypothetical protein M885DRAFT_314190 [Pelagophyceae sp. CCMP2097]
MPPKKPGSKSDPLGAPGGPGTSSDASATRTPAPGRPSADADADVPSRTPDAPQRPDGDDDADTADSPLSSNATRKAIEAAAPTIPRISQKLLLSGVFVFDITGSPLGDKAMVAKLLLQLGLQEGFDGLVEKPPNTAAIEADADVDRDLGAALLFLALAGKGDADSAVAFVQNIGSRHGGAVARASYNSFIAGDAGVDAAAAMLVLHDLSLEAAGRSVTKLVITMLKAVNDFKTATGQSMPADALRHYFIKALDSPTLQHLRDEFTRKGTSLVDMKKELFNLQLTNPLSLLAFTPPPQHGAGAAGAGDLVAARNLVYHDTSLCAYCGHPGHAAQACRKAIEVNWLQGSLSSGPQGPGGKRKAREASVSPPCRWAMQRSFQQRPASASSRRGLNSRESVGNPLNLSLRRSPSFAPDGAAMLPLGAAPRPTFDTGIFGTSRASGGASRAPEQLRFFAYFDEPILEYTQKSVPYENPRVRKCLVTFYPMDSTVGVDEPRLQNSGYMQGKLLKRSRVSGPGGGALQVAGFLCWRGG